MLIFIEGIDGSGKTTLWNKLKALGYSCVNSIPRCKSDSGLGWLKLNEESNVLNENYIMDRSFLSEFVYRSIDGQPVEMAVIRLVQLLYILDYKVIYCKNKNSYENSMIRGEDKITTPIVSKIVDLNYEELMNLVIIMGIKVLEYDWENDSLSDVLEFINDV